MSALPPETIARVARLIPMLSSDKAGEVVAAAAAIERTLKAAACDWHDFADHLGREVQAVVYIDIMRRKTKPPSDLPPLFETLRRSARLEWLDHAVGSALLDDAERALCISLRAQIYSQPHKTIPPRHCAAVSVALGKLWTAGVRA